MARTRSKRGTGSAERRDRTHRRSKAKVAAAAAAALTFISPEPQPITLFNIATLPYEIKAHILELACTSQATSSHPTTDVSLSRAFAAVGLGRHDLPTSLSLMLTCRAFYGLVVPIVYSAVWLARPSSLASFHLAITSRPALGGHVKSLHVGPGEEPVRQHKPLQRQYERAPSELYPTVKTYVKTSLQGSKDVALLTQWYSPDLKRPIHQERPGVHAQVVGRALDAAQRSIDIDLSSHDLDSAGRPLSHSEYTVRMWEVQAALDLYLIQMRCWEEGQGLPDAQVPPSEANPSYPPLVLTGYVPPMSGQDEPRSTGTAYIVSRSALLQHLTRRNACTDRFDHRLIFARSGIDIRGSSLEGGPTERIEPDDCTGSGWPNLSAISDRPPNYLLPNTATIGSLLGLLRSTFPLLPKLKNLSLMGFLELATSGLSLSTVRSLSIGPPAPRLFGALPLDGFTKVQELRVCRSGLGEADVDNLFTVMPSLRRLSLSKGARYTRHSLLSFAKITCHADDRSSQMRANQDLSRPSSSVDDSAGTSSRHVTCSPLADEKAPPLIEVVMHVSDRRQLLEEPESAPRREAWTSGLPFPDQQRRLQVVGSKVRAVPADPMFADYQTGDLYGEGRQWWEEHVNGRARWARE